MASNINSSARRNLIITVIALLVLLILLFLPRRGGNEDTVILPAMKENPDRIVFKREGSQYTFIKKDGEWELEGKGYPGDKVKLGKVAGFIAQEQKAELVSTANVLAPFGLEEETRLEIDFLLGSQLLKKVWVGKSANQFGSFYGITGKSIDDGAAVYQISFDRYSLDQEQKDLLNLKIFDFSSPDADHVTIQDQDGREWVLERVERKAEGTNESVPSEKDWKDSDGKIYPKEKVNDIINIMSSLDGDNMDTELTPTLKDKLNKPLRKTVVTLNNGTTQEIEVIGQENNFYWIKIPEKKFFYRITSNDGEKLLTKLSE